MLCHQLDYTFHWSELWSVSFTAAAEDNSFVQSGDATAALKPVVPLASVWLTDARSEMRKCRTNSWIGIKDDRIRSVTP